MASKKRHVLGLFGKLVLAVLVCCILAFVVPNVLEYSLSLSKIESLEEIESQDESFDAILVLGASINPDGSPSDILRERLDTAIELYELGASSKIIMSGDDQSDISYDEVSAMKAYAVAQGVPSENIFCDHAGVCTYDSMYRARYVFNAQSLLVVTQSYHLYRALFDARFLGMQATGVASDGGSYERQAFFSGREVLARINDFWKVVTNADAEYLSEPVSLEQSGDVTTW